MGGFVLLVFIVCGLILTSSFCLGMYIVVWFLYSAIIDTDLCIRTYNKVVFKGSIALLSLTCLLVMLLLIDFVSHLIP